MKITSRISAPTRSELISAIGNRSNSSDATLFPFSDFTQLLCEIFRWQSGTATKLLAVGPVRPEVELAADRAELELTLINSVSPFAYNLTDIVDSACHHNQILYLANPNRIGGATLNHSELEEIISGCAGSLCIVDEYYFDYFGVTVAEMARQANNLLVLRSFNAAFDNRAHASGYAIGSTETIEQLGRFLIDSQLSLAAQKTMFAALTDDRLGSARVERMADEAMRIAGELSTLGIQCRITPTDFLLIRVASPEEVIQRLSPKAIAVESCRHTEQLVDYIRYDIQRPETNDRLIEAFVRMPRRMYEMQRPDQRATVLKRTIKNRNGASNLTRSDRARATEVSR